MDLYSLKCFVSVAELGNLTKAADCMHVSPSTLSHTIKKLESDIGVSLFDHVGRNIAVSEFGSAYLPYVKRILALNRQALDELEKLKTDHELCVRIADVTTTFASYIISNFQAENADVKLYRDYFSPYDVPLIDLTKRYDFIIGSSNSVIRQDLSSMTLRNSSTLCAVMNKSNHLAGRSSITIDELADEPILTCLSTNAGGKMLEYVFEAAGIVPRIVFEGNSVESILPALDAGLGISIQAKKSAEFNTRRYGDGIAIVPISNCTYHADISLFWSENRKLSASAKRFKSFCAQYTKALNLV